MKFIDPKTDFAFKKIFGSSESKDILISFLNAILYQERPTIEDLEILNPYSPAMTSGLKDTYLDVRAKLDNQTTVLIEMQVLNRVAFDKRVIYNLCKAYSNQLSLGEVYSRLTPVIALTITNFTIFQAIEEVVSYFVFQERSQKIIYNEELELVFIELPKFKKQMEVLETLTDKWLYFLKNASYLQTVPSTFESISPLNHALSIANRANLSLEELEDLQKREMWLEDQENVIIKAKQQGQLELILNLLQFRLGEIPSETRIQIEQLSSEKLEQLALMMFQINSWQDLQSFWSEN
jgi:predicted transposase/invertase (TIGR01784 family)